jgi:AcrR family transcriptional regulator
MTTRAETAATTRRALLDAAAGLLDGGGPEAVTLREVGAKAGVTRSAPYRHFLDKDDLIAVVGTEAWEDLTAKFEDLSRGVHPGTDPREVVRDALLTILRLGRDRPNVYRVMFAGGAIGPPAIEEAANRAAEAYLKIIAMAVGENEARRFGGLLLCGAHGMALLETSGHLSPAKWPPAEELVDLLIDLLPPGPSAAASHDVADSPAVDQ